MVPPTRRRSIAYWVTTVVIGTECVVGGVWGGLQLPPFDGIILHLRYPTYVMTILGFWYVLAGVAIVVPRFPRLKEWAYAGLFLNYTGAIVSHLAVGDGVLMLVGPLFLLGLAGISWGLRPPERRQPATADAAASPSRRRTVAYWITTTFVAFEFSLGGIWDLLQIPYVDKVLKHLGYPDYFTVLLGVWKLAAVVAVLIPRFPRLKEWAYAGMVFSLTGAVASHLAVGDLRFEIVYPTIVTGLTFASWALRPRARRDFA
jgi:uncharacterized membrane protein YphA (DoxX/SURF4 family)